MNISLVVSHFILTQQTSYITSSIYLSPVNSIRYTRKVRTRRSINISSHDNIFTWGLGLPVVSILIAADGQRLALCRAGMAEKRPPCIQINSCILEFLGRRFSPFDLRLKGKANKGSETLSRGTKWIRLPASPQWKLTRLCNWH